MLTETLKKSNTSPIWRPADRGWRLAMLKDGILVVEKYLDRQPRDQATCNIPFCSLLGKTSARTGPIRSIGWSCQALAPICFVLIVFFNLHLQKAPNPYLLGAKRRWLRVNCVERIGIWPLLNYTVISNVYWKPEISKDSKTNSQLEYTGRLSTFQPKRMIYT